MRLAWDTGGSIRAAHWLGVCGARGVRARRRALLGLCRRPGRLPLVAVRRCSSALRSGRRSRRPGLPSRRWRATTACSRSSTPSACSRRSSRSARRRIGWPPTVVVVLGSRRARGLDGCLAARGGRSGAPVLRRPPRLPGHVLERPGGDGARSRSGPPSRSPRDTTCTSRSARSRWAAATAMACLWLGTQSKGGGVALAVSAIVVFAVSGRALAAARAHRCRRRARRVRGGTADGAVPHGAGRRSTTPCAHAGTVTLVLAAIGIARRPRVCPRRPAAPRSGRGADAGPDGSCSASCAQRCWRASSASSRPSTIPVRATQDRWDEFKDIDSDASASSHFGALGSNRYDFWRVAWDEFERHPLAGIGAYGWGNAYLVHGESLETPHRAHSLELDALARRASSASCSSSEPGGAPVRRRPPRAQLARSATGALGTAAYFAVHTGGDWVWTIPAVGLPVFVIAGIALSEDRSSPLPGRVAIPAGIVAVLAALLAFSPPWLSSRFVERAYDAPTPSEAQRRSPLGPTARSAVRRPAISPRRRSSTRRQTSRRCGAPSRSSRETPSCASCSAWRCSTPAATADARARASHRAGALAARRGDSDALERAR